MNTEQTTSPPAQPQATPAQAGTFSFVAAALRVLPTLTMLPFNYAPVGGLGVFTGARMRTWLAYALPLAVMVGTDMILWAIKSLENSPFDYSPFHYSRPIVYGSYLMYVFLGQKLGRNLLGIGAAALLGSVQFFLLTNFGAWLGSPHLYSRTLDGLLQAYALGIPFYQYTLMSDVGFAVAFVGLHHVWARAVQPMPAQEVTPS